MLFDFFSGVFRLLKQLRVLSTQLSREFLPGHDPGILFAVGLAQGLACHRGPPALED